MMTMTRITALAAGLVLALCLGAQADSPVPQPMPKPLRMLETPKVEAPAKLFEGPMQAYATFKPDCIEWTDNCRVCKIDAANITSCSTVGIACTPAAIVCKAVKGKVQ